MIESELIANISDNCQRLKAERKKVKRDIAKHCELSEREVQRIFNGYTMPKLLTIVRLAEFFDVKIEDLVLYKGE